MDIYRNCIRPILFRFDAERVHRGTLQVCEIVGRVPLLHAGLRARLGVEDPRLMTTVAGLRFPNPVGLGAGFDKNAIGTRVIAAAGFGFVEVGSVSAHPSAGNQVRPRLFRLPDDEAVMVFYGVPNDGAAVVRARLDAMTLSVPLGVSLVETNTGRMQSAEHVVREMTEAAERFAPRADYLALNLNCPNSTDGKSPFTAPENLRLLLESYRTLPDLPPVFLKIYQPPEPAIIEGILAVTEPFTFVRGFIVSPLLPRPYTSLRTPQAVLARVPGAASGPFLHQLLNRMVRAWYDRIDRSRYVLIAAGGIWSAEDAFETIGHGAALVQINTALVYRGPTLVRTINRGLLSLLDRHGLSSIADAVGVKRQERMAA